MVNLPSLVSLGASDSFVVYLGLTNGGAYPQAIDDQYPGYTISTANAGDCFYSFDGSTWTDLTDFDLTASFSIDAYTVPEPATLALLAAGAMLAIRRKRRA